MENLNKRPSKGILRFSESSRSNSIEKDIKWDEANIKETLHPDDKDYGFIKIDEPPTPYSRNLHGGESCENSDDEDLQSKTNELLERVSKRIKEPPVTIENVEGLLLDDDEFDAIGRQDEDDGMGVDVENGSTSATASVKIPAASTSNNPLSSCSTTSTTTTTTPRTTTSDDYETSRASGSSCSASDFELKRKRHYNEYYAVKLAKKLMEKEIDNDEDDEDEDEDDSGGSKEK